MRCEAEEEVREAKRALQGEAAEYERDERRDELELGHRAEEAPARRAVRASTRLLLWVR